MAIQDIVFSTLKMAAIAACAFNVGWYISVVVPFVGDFPAWVAAKLMTTPGTQINAIDVLMNGFLNAIVAVYKSMKFPFSTSTLAGIGIIILMLLGGIPFLTLTVGTLIVLKVCTLLMLVLGPLFIAFLLFDSTRHWFWSWVSTMGGFMLSQILFSIVVAFQLNFIYTVIIPNGKIDADWVGAFSILLLFNAFTFVSAALPNIAASVMGGGSVPTASAGGLMGRTLGAATGLNMAKKMAAYFAASRLLRNRIS
ncbi:TrbL/VirB6 plasmid conjugal transfer protein [compost metagenome]